MSLLIFYIEINQIWGRISEHLLLSVVTRYVLSDHRIKVSCSLGSEMCLFHNVQPLHGEILDFLSNYKMDTAGFFPAHNVTLTKDDPFVAEDK
jgi:hypothetical protein